MCGLPRRCSLAVESPIASNLPPLACLVYCSPPLRLHPAESSPHYIKRCLSLLALPTNTAPNISLCDVSDFNDTIISLQSPFAETFAHGNVTSKLTLDLSAADQASHGPLQLRRASASLAAQIPRLRIVSPGDEHHLHCRRNLIAVKFHEPIELE